MTASKPPHRVWVVTEPEEATLGSILERLGERRRAVIDGRVFLNSVRARSAAQPVVPGDRVDVYPQRKTPSEVAVLDERDGVVAVLKPAGMPTEPDRRGRATCLVFRLAEQLRVAPRSLHALSRLDVGVSGIVLVARTPEARRAAQAVRDQGEMVRRYVGIVARTPASPTGCWNQEVPRRRTRSGRVRLTATPALTRFACVAGVTEDRAELRVGDRAAEPALLALEPRTGRKHQLRRHASAAGAPLLGDRAYGGPTRVLHRDGRVQPLRRIALHAARVAWRTLDGAWTVEAPIAPELVDLWVGLGGSSADMSLALQRELP